MPQSWAFFTRRAFLPAAEAGLGGTEQALMELARALVAAGDKVRVVGGATRRMGLDGVAWGPPEPGRVDADRLVAVNDATLLPRRGKGRRIVWFHNEVAFWKEARRGRMGTLLRHRPTAVFVGTEQARLASWLLPFRHRAIIPHGIGSAILTAEPADAPPAPHAVFTSQAYRGLAEILGMWRGLVQPALPEAVFTAFVAERDVTVFALRDPGVTIAQRVGNEAIPALLRDARVWLAPGHASETFCLAAAEAVAMGVPVVTLGRGALKERVRHGVDGFVCADLDEMAARTLDVLTDDALWRRMHFAGLERREGAGWGAVARAWQLLPG
jgi:hypothetical protein